MINQSIICAHALLNLRKKETNAWQALHIILFSQLV